MSGNDPRGFLYSPILLFTLAAWMQGLVLPRVLSVKSTSRCVEGPPLTAPLQEGIVDMSEIDLMYDYIRGLPDEVRKEVRRRKPDSLDAAMKDAEEAEQLLSGGRKKDYGGQGRDGRSDSHPLEGQQFMQQQMIQVQQTQQLQQQQMDALGAQQQQTATDGGPIHQQQQQTPEQQ
uniref:Uncharacterized protein n=1 Tax=Chromera velia CCMP2878 TaxID=1169474 RepID=A0A0K6S6U7_9ALVE